MKADGTLDGSLRCLGPTNDLDQGDKVRRIEGMADDAALGVPLKRDIQSVSRHVDGQEAG